VKISLKRTTVFHPFLFAVFPVLVILSTNMHLLQPEKIILPTLMIVTLASLLWILLYFVIKNNRKAGLVVSLGLVLFFSYGHLYNVLYGTLKLSTSYQHSLLASSFLILFVIGTYYFIKTKRKLDNATMIVNIMAVSLIAISVANIGTYALETNYSLDGADAVSENIVIPMANAENLPNIYYIILDEYAGSEVLEDVYGYDNQEFIRSLNERGFYVPSHAHSNYATTFLSLTSTLNMEYLNYLTSEVGISSQDRKLTNKIFDNNKVIQILKSNGYTIVGFSVSSFKPVKFADSNPCPALIFTDELLIILSESSILKPVLLKYLHLDQAHRDRIHCKFSELSNLHLTTENPFFVFAHFKLPHPPYVFGPNGESVRPESLASGADVWQNKDYYVNQVKFTNKKVLEVIDKILTESQTPPIIIIQGDHGTPTQLGGGGLQWHNQTEDAIKERMTILNAYYLPGDGKSLLYDTITPVNSFKLIFNQYFNGNYDLLEDKMYFSTYTTPFNFTDVTDLFR